MVLNRNLGLRLGDSFLCILKGIDLKSNHCQKIVDSEEMNLFYQDFYSCNWCIV